MKIGSLLLVLFVAAWAPRDLGFLQVVTAIEFQPRLLQKTLVPPSDPTNHAGALSLRAGAAKKSVSKGKSPFGLPGIVDSTVYSHLDFVPFVIYFGILAKILEGTARKVAIGIGSFHFVHSFLTDYDGSGSLAQKIFGRKNMPGLDIAFMYIFDIGAAITFFFLPDLIDGYTETTTTVAKYLALSGLPFFPLCDIAKRKSPK